MLTARAEEECEDAYKWWAKHRSKEEADRWFNGFLERILELDVRAEQFALAAENDLFIHEIRQCNFGLGNRPTHRAVYTIRPDKVVILRIRHLAQRAITPED